MKNNKKYFKYICSFFILFITICFTNAKADTAHNLNIKMDQNIIHLQHKGIIKVATMIMFQENFHHM